MSDEYETHVCPFCKRTVRTRFYPKPVETEIDKMNGYFYIKCEHCSTWYLSVSDCCPRCDAPYCDGW